MKPLRPARSCRRSLRRAAADCGGQSLVEFAFVIPMLVFMLLGMVEFAKLFMQYQMVTDAAREAARQAVIFREAAVSQDSINAEIVAGITTAMQRAGVKGTIAPYYGCQTVGTTPSPDVEVYECGWAGIRGQPATVTIRAPYQFGMLGRFMQVVNRDSRIMLSTSVTMRNE